MTKGDYERELQDDILLSNDIFGRRSSGSFIIDVTCMYFGKGLIFEVKSSKKKTVYLSGKRLKKQYDEYIELKKKYGVPIYYAYRWKTRKHIDTIEKWRVFPIDNIEFTSQGNPVLRWDKGKRIIEWIRELKEKE